MDKMVMAIESCLACHDSKYCKVRWGTACKRQGGKRIPRMKTITVKKIYHIEAKKHKLNKLEERKTKDNGVFEPIRTKAVIW